MLLAATSNMFNSPSMTGMLNDAFSLADLMAGIAVWVVAGFLIVKLVITVLAIARLGGEFKMDSLWHGLFIIFLLLNFSAIFKPFESSVSAVLTEFVEFDGVTMAAHNAEQRKKASGITLSSDDLKKLQDEAKKNAISKATDPSQPPPTNKTQNPSNSTSSMASAVTSYIFAPFENIVGTILGFIMWIINMLMSILIRLMIHGSIILFTIIFIIFLPLALMVDYMPGQKNVGVNLLMALIGIKFWVVALKIVDLANGLLMKSVMALASNVGVGSVASFGDGAMMVIFSIIILGAYIAIPFFSNLILPTQASTVWSQGSGLLMKSAAAGVSFGSSMIATQLLAGNMLNPTGKQMLGKMFQSEYGNYQSEQMMDSMKNKS